MMRPNCPTFLFFIYAFRQQRLSFIPVKIYYIIKKNLPTFLISDLMSAAARQARGPRAPARLAKVPSAPARQARGPSAAAR